MSVPHSEHRPRDSARWLQPASLMTALAAVWLVTLGVAWLTFDQSGTTAQSNPVVYILLLGPALLVLWGSREIVLRVLERLRRGGSRRYRAHIHREALMYILILVVIGLGAFFGRSNLLLLVFGLLAGPFVLGGQVTLLILNRLHVTRSLPEIATAGERFAVRLKLANRKPLLSAWMVVAADTLSNSREEIHPAVLFARVPPRGEREAMYAVRPAHRGRHRLGPMRVTCAFPLGLVERSFEVGETEELVVGPRIGRLTDRWRNDFHHEAPAAECALTRIGVFDEHFHRLREYRGGDNPRAIHWRTTARRNELMVREYQHHRDPEIRLVLDLWQPVKPARDDLERVELAVSFAATICAEHAEGSGDAPVRLTICGRELSSADDFRENPALSVLLERLALAEAGPTPPLSAAIDEATGAAESGMRRILISTRPASEVAARVAGAEGSPAGNGAGPAGFLVITADAQSLQAYLTYDESDSTVTA